MGRVGWLVCPGSWLGKLASVIWCLKLDFFSLECNGVSSDKFWDGSMGSHWLCLHSRVCAFPFYSAQAPGCSIWSGPCLACGSSFRVFHKSMDLVGPPFCAFPSLSSSGSQELDGRTFPGCGAPSPLRGPSLSFLCVPVGCVRLVSVLWSWPLAATLLADVNHPESPEVFC